MAARSTQGVIAALSVVGLAYTQASQVVVAALTQVKLLPVRASQIKLEAMVAPTTNARASCVVVEVLVWNYEVVMPSVYPVLPGLSYSVIKRPKWFTGTGTSASGREVRVGYAANPLWEWDLTYEFLRDTISQNELKTLMGFYLSQAGSLGGFLFLDPDDHAVAAQAIGTTDGTTTLWTLQRTFGGNDGTGTEPIGYVNTGAPFNVYLNGTLADPSTYDLLTTAPVNQQIRFHAAPASGQAITVDMGFYYYARFKDDHYDFEKFMDRLWTLQTVTLMSLRG